MAFWGSVLKPGETTTLDAEPGTLFHLSQACLCDPKDGGKNYLVANVEDKKYFLCCLQKEKTEHFALDCFFSTESGVSFTNNGKSEMHVVGYLESKPEEHDEFCQHGHSDEESDEDEEEGSDEEMMAEAVEKLPEPSKAKAPASKKENEASSAAAAKTKAGAAPAPSKAVVPTKEVKKPEGAKAAASPAPPTAAGDKKRKAEEPAAAPAQEKKAKQEAKPAAAAAASGEDGSFQKSIEDFLKKNGRTDMAKLGSSVKKPAGVSSKLGQFIKARPDVFKVDGSFVELIKK